MEFGVSLIGNRYWVLYVVALHDGDTRAKVSSPCCLVSRRTVSSLMHLISCVLGICANVVPPQQRRFLSRRAVNHGNVPTTSCVAAMPNLYAFHATVHLHPDVFAACHSL